MPDLDLLIAEGQIRVFSLLREGRGALIRLGSRGSIDPTPWSDRVDAIEGTVDDGWELPVIGPVEAPAAVLVRPDGGPGLPYNALP